MTALNVGHQNITWRVGDGSLANSQTNPWVPNVGPLKNHASDLVPIYERSKSIIEHVSDHRSWSLENFVHLIPEPVVNRIKAMVPPHASNIEDSITWKQANDGIFSMA